MYKDFGMHHSWQRTNSWHCLCAAPLVTHMRESSGFLAACTTEHQWYHIRVLKPLTSVCRRAGAYQGPGAW